MERPCISCSVCTWSVVLHPGNNNPIDQSGLGADWLYSSFAEKHLWIPLATKLYISKQCAFPTKSSNLLDHFKHISIASRWSAHRTKGNGHKLKYRTFSLNTRNIFVFVVLWRCSNRGPGCPDRLWSLGLGDIQTPPGHSNMLCLTLLWADGWSMWSPEIPANHNYCVILSINRGRRETSWCASQPSSQIKKVFIHWT